MTQKQPRFYSPRGRCWRVNNCAVCNRWLMCLPRVQMVVTGAKSEEESRTAARIVAKIVRKLGFAVTFKAFRIQNLVCTGSVGFPIRLEGLADEHGRLSSVRLNWVVYVKPVFVRAALLWSCILVRAVRAGALPWPRVPPGAAQGCRACVCVRQGCPHWR